MSLALVASSSCPVSGALLITALRYLLNIVSNIYDIRYRLGMVSRAFAIMWMNQRQKKGESVLESGAATTEAGVAAIAHSITWNSAAKACAVPAADLSAPVEA